MGTYTYEQLSRVGRIARLSLALKGLFPPRGIRRKPRDPAKKELLFIMATERMKKYRPYRSPEGIVLPYFRTKG